MFPDTFLVRYTILAENEVIGTGDNSLRKGRDGCFPDCLTPINEDQNPTPAERSGVTSIHPNLILLLPAKSLPGSCELPQSSAHKAALNICDAGARPPSHLLYPPLLEPSRLQRFISVRNLSGRWNPGITFGSNPARPSLPNRSDADMHTHNSGALMRARTSLGRDNRHFSSLIRGSLKVGQSFIWKLCWTWKTISLQEPRDKVPSAPVQKFHRNICVCYQFLKRGKCPFFFPGKAFFPIV